MLIPVPDTALSFSKAITLTVALLQYVFNTKRDIWENAIPAIQKCANMHGKAIVIKTRVTCWAY
jgi:hypothetical protein